MNCMNFGGPLTFHFAAPSGQIIVQKIPPASSVLLLVLIIRNKSMLTS